MRARRQHRVDAAAGFTLLEALVALAIVALVITNFLSFRTSAITDATGARNWRLAREIAEERLSELLAGAHDVEPQSGLRISLEERYPGFAYQIVRGESSIAEVEASIANAAADLGAEGTEVSERMEWQDNRDILRKAQARGLSAYEYQDQIAAEEIQRRTEAKAPSEQEFEEVAVIVTFPKLNAAYEGQEESLVIKTKISTLAWSGMTPEQAQQEAERLGQATAASAPAAGSADSGGGTGGNPFAGGGK